MPSFPVTGVGRNKNVQASMMAGPPVIHPMQILFQEHVKCMMAVKELQSQVQKLNEFRSRVLQAFPQLESLGPYAVPSKQGPSGAGSEAPSRKSTISSVKTARVLPAVSQQYGSRRPVPQSQYGNRPSNGQRGQLRDKSQWPSDKFVVIAQGKNWLRIRPCPEKSDSEDVDSDDEHHSTSDSLHSMMDPPLKRKPKVVPGGRKGEGAVMPRQDSGFSTDGKERLHQDRSSDVHWVKFGSATDDELMTVLDLISEKSEVLRKQADQAVDQGEALGDIGLKSDAILNELEQLCNEKEQLIDRLGVAEAERDLFRTEVLRLRDSLTEMESNRQTVEDRLEMVYMERERLGGKRHSWLPQFSRNSNQKSDCIVGAKKESTGQSAPDGSGGPMLQPLLGQGSRSLPDRLGQTKLKVRMDKSKISAILQETRALELQRQLLVAVLRNEVLRTQLEQSLGELHQKTATWQQTEYVLKSSMEQLQRSHGDLDTKLQQTETELRVERSKRQVLERALQAAYKDLTSSTVRGECVSSTENVRQLSVEVFPIHQIPLNHPSEKLIDRSSPVPWQPMEPLLGPNVGSIVNADYCSAAMGTSNAPGDFNEPFFKGHSNGPQQRVATVYGDQTDPRERVYQSGDSCLRGKEGDLERNNPIATLCPHLSRGNMPTSEMGKSAFSRSSMMTSQVIRRLSLNEVNAAKRDRHETKFMPHSYVTRSSPKSQPEACTPKYSQSAEDLQNSNWEWTYDLRDTSQHFANVPQQMSQAAN